MPSTDRTVSLAISYRRADVVAFWILGTLIVWLSSGFAAAAIEVREPWGWGAAAAATLLLPGVFWRPWFETGVWIWNGGVRRITAVLRRYVLAVSYHILFVAVGMSGAFFDRVRRRSDSSRWLYRDLNATRHDAVTSRGNNLAPDHSLSAFARIPGNEWVFSVFPLVFLMTLLGDDQHESAVLSSTYTLY